MRRVRAGLPSQHARAVSGARQGSLKRSKRSRAGCGAVARSAPCLRSAASMRPTAPARDARRMTSSESSSARSMRVISTSCAAATPSARSRFQARSALMAFAAADAPGGPSSSSSSAASCSPKETSPDGKMGSTWNGTRARGSSPSAQRSAHVPRPVWRESTGSGAHAPRSAAPAAAARGLLPQHRPRGALGRRSRSRQPRHAHGSLQRPWQRNSGAPAAPGRAHHAVRRARAANAGPRALGSVGKSPGETHIFPPNACAPGPRSCAASRAAATRA